MALLTGVTKGGGSWTPTFVESVDPEKCIGCGRCFKSCSRKVLGPIEIEDEETDTINMKMTVVNGDACIGCAGCGVACPKKCFSFATMDV